MKKDIQKIKELLDQLESKDDEESEKSFKQSFELFELPEIVSSIVDYLQPLLTPYEAGIYWYMFRHSVIESGDVFIRVSIKILKENVITSSSGSSTNISRAAVNTALAGLERKGAIQKAGDTTRDGTLFRLFLPEEIEIAQERMAGLQKEQLPKVDSKKELDFYNVKENRQKIFERDSYKCHYCKKQLTRFSATLDHIQPVSEGGDNSYDNLITACLHCNSQRGANPVMDAITRKEQDFTSESGK